MHRLAAKGSSETPCRFKESLRDKDASPSLRSSIKGHTSQERDSDLDMKGSGYVHPKIRWRRLVHEARTLGTSHGNVQKGIISPICNDRR